MRVETFPDLLYASFLLLSCHAAKLPKYRAVVYPEVYDARDSEGTRVLRINEKITLNLKPASVLHPQFFLRTYHQGVPRHTYFNVDALEANLYDDEKQFAAVILNEEHDVLHVNGVVGPNLKIRPAEGMERSEEGRHAHILETIHDTDSSHVYGKLPEETAALIAERGSKMDPDAYSVQTIYAEIFVVVDSRFRQGFPSYENMLFYLMVEFRVVNLRYRTVSNPNIQLVYRGIEESDYRQEHQYYKYIDYGIDALKSLYGIVEYVAANDAKYKMYDMVYFITGQDMIAVEGSKKESALQGFAFVASACTRNRQQLGEDKAHSYIGIRIMAHEVGHTMGCSHDGTATDGVIEKFKSDSSTCPWQDGFIMSYIEEDSRSFQFSSCCNYMMSLVSWSVVAACLRSNQTDTRLTGVTEEILLPGEILDRNKQCELTYPTLRKTYFMSKYRIQDCKAQCFVPGWQFRASDSQWPMLLIDGSVCNDEYGWICINGRCVPPGGHRRRPSNGPRRTTPITTTTKKRKSVKRKSKLTTKSTTTKKQRATNSQKSSKTKKEKKIEKTTETSQENKTTRQNPENSSTIEERERREEA